METLMTPALATSFGVFFSLQLIRTSYVAVISSQFLFLLSVVPFRFNIVF